MSYSDGSIKEVLLDTNSFSQQRCEFRVPSEMSVLSNMKLLNVGAIRANGTAQFYNRGAGVLGLIKNIRLMDGANVLSESREVGKQMTFKNFNNSNNVNESYRGPMNLSSSSYVYSFYPDATTPAIIRKGYTPVQYDAQEMSVDTTESTTSKGMVMLSDLLPFLNKVEMLDNMVFKNGLRLVIEWETDRLKMTTKNDGTLTILQPLLCMYDVVGPELYNELKMTSGVFSWYEREVDRNFYSAVSSQTQRFTGFNSKRVLRFCVSKEYSSSAPYLATNDVRGVGKNGSVSLFGEKMNFSNNGSQVFPNSLKQSQLSRQVVNSFGDCAAFEGFNKIQGEDDDDSFPKYFESLRSDALSCGDFGYAGVTINNDKCNNVEVKLERVIPANPVDRNHGESVNMFLFGDVAKIMSVSNGKYTVGYA